MTVDGEEIWPRVMASILGDPSRYDVGAWDADTLRALQMIPNYYLAYYYYTDARIAAQADWPPSRAEEVMEIEERLLDTYADEENDSVPPDLLERGGAYYSTVATQLLNAHHNDLGETHVVNVKHDGAVPGWPEDWVLEMPCRVDGDGVHPLPAEPLPPVCFGLLAQVKMYELLTVEAAVNGDRQAAHKALLAHPLGPSADRVEDVLDDLLETHRTHLPQF
jgi:6-phospho-beta-glucosidase